MSKEKLSQTITFKNSASETFQELFKVFSEIGKILEVNHRKGYFKGQLRKQSLPWMRPIVEVTTVKSQQDCVATITVWNESETFETQQTSEKAMRQFLERVLSRKDEKQILFVKSSQQ